MLPMSSGRPCSAGHSASALTLTSGPTPAGSPMMMPISGGLPESEPKTEIVFLPLVGAKPQPARC